MFDYVVPNWTTYIDCDSSNGKYLITCNRCFQQFVGETVQKLNKRFNWNRTGFNKSGKRSLCRILSDHSHKFVVLILLIILEKVKGNGKAARNALNASITSRGKQDEKTWMLKFRCSHACV